MAGLSSVRGSSFVCFANVVIISAAQSSIFWIDLVGESSLKAFQSVSLAVPILCLALTGDPTGRRCDQIPFGPHLCSGSNGMLSSRADVRRSRMRVLGSRAGARISLARALTHAHAICIVCSFIYFFVCTETGTRKRTQKYEPLTLKIEDYGSRRSHSDAAMLCLESHISKLSCCYKASYAAVSLAWN